MRAAQREAMPRHDPVPTPIPPERDPRALERAHRAWLKYVRMMRWMALASVAAVAAALLYLKLTGTPMGLHLVIATAAGVGLSVLLGTALMGLVFLSDSGGHDDAAAGKDQRR
jgi:predicted anti-sigma-YlaC factor YlaD